MERKVCVVLISLLAVALVTAGCSDNQPLNTDQAASPYTSERAAATLTTGPAQFVAQVQTTDQNQRMLTFEGEPDTVIALQNCQIVRLQNDHETPIPFEGIGPGDSAYVNGVRMQDGYVYAHQLLVCSGDCDGLCFDVSFRDTIATIDYAGGSFTVLNRDETITVDGNTLIWGVVTRHYGGPTCTKQEGSSDNAAGEGPGHSYTKVRDTVLLFSDLEVGDVVEVRADVVDSSTLLAGKIKLAGCNDIEKRCVEFSDYLGSVDSQTGLVTFENYAWIGTVCPSASLTDLDGAPITLDDFSAGDYVDVKGFPLDGDSLNICQMAQAAP